MQPRQLIDLTTPPHKCAPIPLVTEHGISRDGQWQARPMREATHSRVIVFVCPDCSKTFDIGFEQRGGDNGGAS